MTELFMRPPRRTSHLCIRRYIRLKQRLVRMDALGCLGMPWDALDALDALDAFPRHAPATSLPHLWPRLVDI